MIVEACLKKASLMNQKTAYPTCVAIKKNNNNNISFTVPLVCIFIIIK
jgi:hypothetical protein